MARSHPKWGERPMAFVILHKHHIKTWEGRHDGFSQELKQYAKTRLPGFACPEWVTVVEDLPVSLRSGDLQAHVFITQIENVDGENSQDKLAKDRCEALGDLHVFVFCCCIYKMQAI